MPRGDTYRQGVIEGRQRTLRVLSVSVDMWPTVPSEISMELLTGGEIDFTAVHHELQRFAEKIAEQQPKRRRRANAGEVAIGDQSV